MATQIKLPNLGENIESGDVLSIFVKEGDTVQANQDLMEMRNTEAPYDAIVEWWWQGTQALTPQMETPEAKAALKALFQHQKTFINIEKSPSFFTIA